jgi:phospholipid/cholesterol/gamma-HCH transport system substrate-binding protein
MQFRVGVMFLATLLIAGILLVSLNKLPTLTGSVYPIQILFTDASGVTKDTPVRKSGVLIGRVSNIRLIEKDAKVLVTAKIYSDKVIYTNEECVIVRNFISGDSAISFSAHPKKRFTGQIVAPDSVLDGRMTDDPTGLKKELDEPISTINKTGEALREASEQLGAAAKRVEAILNDETQENVQSVLRNAAKSLATIQSIMGEGENEDKLRQAMQRLPETLDSMNATFKSTNQALQSFTQPAAPGEKTPIERMLGTIEMTERTLRKFSEPSADGKPAPADQIARAMENINDITDLMRTIMTRIEQGEGSLGALMNDRQLYDRLNRTVKNLEDVSWKLKPIVDDARVFSDKIARHPGLIVRDAVKPQPGIK